MTIRSGLKMMLLAAAAMILAAPSAMAGCPCDVSVILAAADTSTSPGQSCGGNYLDTHVSDDTYQCLQETSALTHTWRFDNVPAGAISFVREGNRPANPNGDNFKFSLWYYAGASPYYLLVPAAIIKKTFELQGGECFDLSHTTTETETFWVVVQDTAAEGGSPHQATVNIDYLAVCSSGVGD